jgi:two-component system cell cycle response regulator
LAYTILIIDNSEAVKNGVRKAIQTAGLVSGVVEASNGMEGFKVLLNDQIDLVLCDLGMPGIDGHQFLTMLRERAEFAEIPIIVLTSKKGAETKIKALNAGASDYLVKPFSDDELLARVKIHLQMKKLRDELREKNAKLEELSNTDGLTKVSNQRRLMDVVDLEFRRAERYRSSLSFIMVDLDSFRELNDTWGPVIGDHVLLATATLIQEGLRVNDTIGRYDADKFGIVLPETDLEGATVVAKRYRSQLEELPILEDNERLRITASFGAVCYPHKEIVVVHDLVKKADKALSIAKAGGGNRVVILE